MGDVLLSLYVDLAFSCFTFGLEREWKSQTQEMCGWSSLCMPIRQNHIIGRFHLWLHSSAFKRDAKVFQSQLSGTCYG